MYYEEYSYGAVSIYTDNGEKVCFMQGDEYHELMDEIEKLDELWNEIYSKESENETCFNSYEEHLNMLLEPYTILMEEA